MSWAWSSLHPNNIQVSRRHVHGTCCLIIADYAALPTLVHAGYDNNEGRLGFAGLRWVLACVGSTTARERESADQGE